MSRLTVLGVLMIAIALVTGCGGEQPATTPTPAGTPGPSVNTYLELTSAVSAGEESVTVRGSTNLPDGAVIRVKLFLHDESGGWPKDTSGGNLTPVRAMGLVRPSVQHGNYSAQFNLSYFAGGRCLALVEFLPWVGQPDFISNAFGDKGQNMTGAHLGGEWPNDWGVIRMLDGSVYYACPVIEFYWHPEETPAAAATG